MTSYPYKAQEKQKKKLTTGDWILFQENKEINALWSGNVVSIDREADVIIVCTDMDEDTQDDFTLSKIVLHIESSWQGFDRLADKTVYHKYA